MSKEASHILSPTIARRLAVTRQHLACQHPSANSEGIMEVMHSLRYLQIDPMKVVAPSHTLVLWSRLRQYDVSLLDKLLYEERLLLEDWAQATSIVLTEDYPIFAALKRTFAAGDSSWAKKIRDWMRKNEKFSAYILKELGRKGPLLSSQFEDRAIENWSSTGWTEGRNVDVMLSFLKAQGKVMTAGRLGNRRLWSLTERFLPKWVSREQLDDHELFKRVTQLSLRALGVARPDHIQKHYTRNCYGKLDETLAELEAEEYIKRVEIKENGKSWSGPWYVHADNLPLLDSLEDDEWKPRTTLLSPFDNLISDRKRTEQLFNFHFRFEVYVPKAQRKYGCYVMPILHGDRLIGRVDPVMDRKRERLVINAVYAEQDAPKSREAALAVAGAIEELGEFLEAKETVYGSRKPEIWKGFLH